MSLVCKINNIYFDFLIHAHCKVDLKHYFSKLASFTDGYHGTLSNSGGFRVGGPEARLKRGPSDDVIMFSQP